MRRALVLAAGAAVAMAAALSVGAPASAHHSTVTGTCAQGTDGGWVVTWTVSNSEKDIPATLKTVRWKPEGTTLTTIQVGATVPAGGQLTGVQTVPAGQRWAQLTVSSEWVRNGKPVGEHNGKPKSGKVWFDKDKCAPAPSPSASPSVSPSATPTATPPATSPATPTPSGTPAPGGGGGLPVTGTAVGGIVGAAAVLLAAGAVLFLVARRRRVRFTA
jgi:hypothetical protein